MLWEWYEKDLITELLLANDNLGKTAWHTAAEEGQIEVLHLYWAEKVLTPDEIINNTFQTKNNFNMIA
jgi:hypothetical protein